MSICSGGVYGRWRRPCDRVYAALERISRDKWLPPSEVYRIGIALARKCSGNPGRTLESAAYLALHVGMIGGRPIAVIGQETYRDALKLAEKFDQKERPDARAEIEIIKLKARQHEYDRRAS